jgi:hypothetical protein
MRPLIPLKCPQLRALIECLEVAHEAAADHVAAEGDVIAGGERIVTKSGPKAHPCIREETSVRAFICRTLQRLGITDEPVKPTGRPAKGFGWRGPDAD